MKVNRSEFVGLLLQVQPGLAAKEVVEQSTSFVFKDGYIITFNDEVAVRVKSKVDLEGAVQGKELLDLLQRLTAEEVDLSIKDNEIQVKAGKSKAGIRLEAEITMPLDEIKPPKKWNPLPEGTMDALKFCLFSVGRDTSQPILTNLHFEGSHVESSDGYRATRYAVKGEFPTAFLLPASAAKELSKYSPTQHNISGGWAHFKTDDGIYFSCRIYEDEFPELEEFFKVKGGKLKMPEGMKDILNRAGIFTASIDDTLGERIEVFLKPGTLRVRGEGPKGWFEESTDLEEYEGEEGKFLINPNFLAQALSILDYMTVGDIRLKLVGKNFQHIVALLVPEEE